MVAGAVAIGPFGPRPVARRIVGPAPTTIRLRDYQRRGVRYARRAVHPALFWEMRLGKTLVAIRTVKTYGAGLVLVVAPFSAFQGWREDLWAEGEPAPVELTGTKKRRRGRLETALNATDPGTGRRWFLLNLQGWSALREIAGVSWISLILDESTFIKDARAKCTRFFVSNFRRVPHRWILSGTPAPEDDLEYWTQAAFLDPAIFGHGNFWQFRQQWAQQCQFDWILKPEGKAFISARLAGRVSFLKRSDVRLGGVKIRQTKLVELPAAARAIYKKTARTFVLDLPGETEARRTIYAGQRHVWFRRLADGFIPDAPEPVVHSAKLDELRAILSGPLACQQTVIWAVYTAEVEWLARSIPGADFVHGDVSPAQRDAKKAAFQAGAIRHLVVQPETMKYGAKLTAAGALVYFSSPEGALTRSQSEDRAIDVSRQDAALVIDIITADTIDEDIAWSLLRKETRSETLRRIVRGIERAAA